VANIAIIVNGPPQVSQGQILVDCTAVTSTGVVAGRQLVVNFGRSSTQINTDLQAAGMQALHEAGYVDNTGGADVIKLFGGAI
jgi:hypothetical protein